MLVSYETNGIERYLEPVKPGVPFNQTRYALHDKATDTWVTKRGQLTRQILARALRNGARVGLPTLRPSARYLILDVDYPDDRLFHRPDDADYLRDQCAHVEVTRSGLHVTWWFKTDVMLSRLQGTVRRLHDEGILKGDIDATSVGTFRAKDSSFHRNKATIAICTTPCQMPVIDYDEWELAVHIDDVILTIQAAIQRGLKFARTSGGSQEGQEEPIAVPGASWRTGGLVLPGEWNWRVICSGQWRHLPDLQSVRAISPADMPESRIRDRWRRVEHGWDNWYGKLTKPRRKAHTAPQGTHTETGVQIQEFGVATSQITPYQDLQDHLAETPNNRFAQGCSPDGDISLLERVCGGTRKGQPSALWLLVQRWLKRECPMPRYAATHEGALVYLGELVCCLVMMAATAARAGYEHFFCTQHQMMAQSGFSARAEARGNDREAYRKQFGRTIMAEMLRFFPRLTDAQGQVQVVCGVFEGQVFPMNLYTASPAAQVAAVGIGQAPKKQPQGTLVSVVRRGLRLLAGITKALMSAEDEEVLGDLPPLSAGSAPGGLARLAWGPAG